MGWILNLLTEGSNYGIVHTKFRIGLFPKSAGCHSAKPYFEKSLRIRDERVICLNCKSFQNLFLNSILFFISTILVLGVKISYFSKIRLISKTTFRKTCVASNDLFVKHRFINTPSFGTKISEIFQRSYWPSQIQLLTHDTSLVHT